MVPPILVGIWAPEQPITKQAYFHTEASKTIGRANQEGSSNYVAHVWNDRDELIFLWHWAYIVSSVKFKGMKGLFVSKVFRVTI